MKGAIGLYNYLTNYWLKNIRILFILSDIKRRKNYTEMVLSFLFWVLSIFYLSSGNYTTRNIVNPNIVQIKTTEQWNQLHEDYITPKEGFYLLNIFLMMLTLVTLIDRTIFFEKIKNTWNLLRNTFIAKSNIMYIRLFFVFLAYKLQQICIYVILLPLQYKIGSNNYFMNKTRQICSKLYERLKKFHIGTSFTSRTLKNLKVNQVELHNKPCDMEFKNEIIEDDSLFKNAIQSNLYKNLYFYGIINVSDNINIFSNMPLYMDYRGNKNKNYYFSTVQIIDENSTNVKEAISLCIERKKKKKFLLYHDQYHDVLVVKTYYEDRNDRVQQQQQQQQMVNKYSTMKEKAKKTKYSTDQQIKQLENDKTEWEMKEQEEYSRENSLIWKLEKLLEDETEKEENSFEKNNTLKEELEDCLKNDDKNTWSVNPCSSNNTAAQRNNEVKTNEIQEETCKKIRIDPYSYTIRNENMLTIHSLFIKPNSVYQIRMIMKDSFFKKAVSTSQEEVSKETGLHKIASRSSEKVMLELLEKKKSLLKENKMKKDSTVLCKICDEYGLLTLSYKVDIDIYEEIKVENTSKEKFFLSLHLNHISFLKKEKVVILRHPKFYKNEMYFVYLKKNIKEMKEYMTKTIHITSTPQATIELNFNEKLGSDQEEEEEGGGGDWNEDEDEKGPSYIISNENSKNANIIFDDNISMYQIADKNNKNRIFVKVHKKHSAFLVHHCNINYDFQKCPTPLKNIFYCRGQVMYRKKEYKDLYNQIRHNSFIPIQIMYKLQSKYDIEIIKTLQWYFFNCIENSISVKEMQTSSQRYDYSKIFSFVRKEREAEDIHYALLLPLEEQYKEKQVGKEIYIKKGRRRKKNNKNKKNSRKYKWIQYVMNILKSFFSKKKPPISDASTNCNKQKKKIEKLKFLFKNIIYNFDNFDNFDEFYKKFNQTQKNLNREIYCRCAIDYSYLIKVFSAQIEIYEHKYNFLLKNKGNVKLIPDFLLEILHFPYVLHVFHNFNILDNRNETEYCNLTNLNFNIYEIYQQSNTYKRTIILKILAYLEELALYKLIFIITYYKDKLLYFHLLDEINKDDKVIETQRMIDELFYNKYSFIKKNIQLFMDSKKNYEIEGKPLETNKTKTIKMKPYCLKALCMILFDEYTQQRKKFGRKLQKIIQNLYQIRKKFPLIKNDFYFPFFINKKCIIKMKNIEQQMFTWDKTITTFFNNFLNKSLANLNLQSNINILKKNILNNIKETLFETKKMHTVRKFTFVHIIISLQFLNPYRGLIIPPVLCFLKVSSANSIFFRCFPERAVESSIHRNRAKKLNLKRKESYTQYNANYLIEDEEETDPFNEYVIPCYIEIMNSNLYIYFFDKYKNKLCWKIEKKQFALFMKGYDSKNSTYAYSHLDTNKHQSILQSQADKRRKSKGKKQKQYIELKHIKEEHLLEAIQESFNASKNEDTLKMKGQEGVDNYNNNTYKYIKYEKENILLLQDVHSFRSIFYNALSKYIEEWKEKIKMLYFFLRFSEEKIESEKLFQHVDAFIYISPSQVPFLRQSLLVNGYKYNEQLEPKDKIAINKSINEVTIKYLDMFPQIISEETKQNFQLMKQRTLEILTNQDDVYQEWNHYNLTFLQKESSEWDEESGIRIDLVTFSFNRKKIMHIIEELGRYTEEEDKRRKRKSDLAQFMETIQEDESSDHQAKSILEREESLKREKEEIKKKKLQKEKEREEKEEMKLERERIREKEIEAERELERMRQLEREKEKINEQEMENQIKREGTFFNLIKKIEKLKTMKEKNKEVECEIITKYKEINFYNSNQEVFCRYIGTVKNNLYNGEGKLIDKFGNLIYNGEWLEGERNGKGKFLFKYLNIWYLYEGEFLNDQIIDKGVISLIDKELVARIHLKKINKLCPLLIKGNFAYKQKIPSNYKKNVYTSMILRTMERVILAESKLESETKSEAMNNVDEWSQEITDIYMPFVNKWNVYSFYCSSNAHLQEEAGKMFDLSKDNFKNVIGFPSFDISGGFNERQETKRIGSKENIRHTEGTAGTVGTVLSNDDATPRKGKLKAWDPEEFKQAKPDIIFFDKDIETIHEEFIDFLKNSKEENSYFPVVHRNAGLTKIIYADKSEYFGPVNNRGQPTTNEEYPKAFYNNEQFYYEGEMQNLLPHGYGLFKNKGNEKNSYLGFFNQGYREGKGNLNLKNKKYIIQADFFKDEIYDNITIHIRDERITRLDITSALKELKKIKIFFRNGYIFYGYFTKEMKKSGIGILIDNNNKILYHGYYTDDVIDKYCYVLRHKDNKIYTGNLNKGVKQGFGKLYYEEKLKFENDKGFNLSISNAEILARTLESYEGIDINSDVSFNISFDSTHIIYSGYWNNNSYDHFGSCNLKNGIYKGDIKDSLKHGVGVYIYKKNKSLKNKNRYVAAYFKNDRIHQMGKYYNEYDKATVYEFENERILIKPTVRQKCLKRERVRSELLTTDKMYNDDDIDSYITMSVSGMLLDILEDIHDSSTSFINYLNQPFQFDLNYFLQI